MNITVVPMTWDDAALAGWLALGGGAGAALRYVLDVAVSSRWRRPFPLATSLINVSGSLALGLLVGWFYAGAAKPGWSLAVSVIGTGLLGGYTTFSTASYDTLRLGREGRVVMALAYAVGTMAATIAAAASGLWLGEWWATV
ncbi:fluoride efflux transporter FluC [Dietzia maris]|uniref:fluoride efflux transporter FluC n=2 Tax=Dietzia TaxID=37914 RepID=UPI00232E8DA5|nr:CrcB family protein [Dietzia maris]